MNHRFLPISAMMLATAFMACQQNTAPNIQANPKAIGILEVVFDTESRVATAAIRSNQLQTQIVRPSTAVSFTAPTSLGVLTGASEQFIIATFNVNNLVTATNLTDVTLVAYQQFGNIGGTALRNVYNFAGSSTYGVGDAAGIAFARSVKPVNPPTSFPPFVVNSAVSDVQFFTEGEISTLTGIAGAELNTGNGEYLLPYGYVARRNATSRTLLPGNAAGTVSIAIRVPNSNIPTVPPTTNNNAYRFSMTFVVFDAPVATRVSESLEEQGAGSGANARKTGFSATELFALGGSSLLSNPSVKRGCVIRTAGASGAATATLVDTFSLSTTPIANSINAAASANLNLTLDRNGVTPVATNWITRGEFTGDKAGAFSGGGSSTLTFNPTNNFKPGELVTTTLKSGAITTSPASNPCVTGAKTWQFRAGVTAGGGTYSAKTDTATGNGPLAVLGDMNNDGNLDVIAVSDASSQVSVLPGNGSGGFGTRVTFATGTTPYTLAVGDLNADGKLDIVTANEGSNNASVLINNTSSGTPSFATAVPYSAGTRPYGVALADVSSDGILDMIVSNFGQDAHTAADTLSVRLGTGTGTFGAETTFGTGNRPNIIAVGDVNNDGKLDLVVANQTPIDTGTIYTVNVLLGTGNGSFQTKVDYEIATGSVSVALGDINNDGNLDVVTANQDATGAKGVSVLRGNGDGTFQTKSDLATGNTPVWVALGDVNGDNNLDIVIANSAGTNGVSVIRGNGNGTFQAKTDYTAGNSPISASLGDLNGDGKLDIIIANYNANTISVLLNP